MDFFCTCPHLNYLEFEFLLDLSLIAVITSAWQKFVKSPFQCRCAHAKPLATGQRGQWAKLSGQTAKGAFFSARFACFALLLTAGFSADARPCARCNWLPGKSLLESPDLEDHTSFCPLSHLQAFWRLFFEHFATLSQIFWRFKCKFHFFGARGTRFFSFFSLRCRHFVAAKTTRIAGLASSLENIGWSCKPRCDSVKHSDAVKMYSTFPKKPQKNSWLVLRFEFLLFGAESSISRGRDRMAVSFREGNDAKSWI